MKPGKRLLSGVLHRKSDRRIPACKGPETEEAAEEKRLLAESRIQKGKRQVCLGTS